MPLVLIGCAIAERHVEEREVVGVSGRACVQGECEAAAAGGHAGNSSDPAQAGAAGALSGFGGTLETESSYAEPVTRVPGAVVVSAPEQVRLGFGSSLATAPTDLGALLWVGGTPLVSGFAELELAASSGGEIDVAVVPTPLTNASDFYLTGSPAALPPDPTLGAIDPRAGQPCFASGVINGFFSLYCRAAPLSLQAPRKLVELLAFSFVNGQPTRVDFASGPTGSDLLVTANDEREAWYLPSSKGAALALAPPLTERRGTRRTPAIVDIHTYRLLVIGLPDEDRVMFYRLTAEGPTYWGCWQGDPGFGTAITAGQLQAAGTYPRSLVVASNNAVYVYTGKRVLDLEAACTAPPAPVAAYTCSLVDGTACPDSQFGAALAVGDLDEDGRDELVVGAPQLRADQTPPGGEAPGGVFVLHAPDSVPELKRLDPPLLGGELGTSLSIARVGNHNIIAAGAPKAGKVVLFH